MQEFTTPSNIFDQESIMFMDYSNDVLLSQNIKESSSNSKFLLISETIEKLFITPYHQMQFAKNISLIKSKYCKNLVKDLTIEELIKAHYTSNKGYQ